MSATTNWTQFYQQALTNGATSGTVVFPVAFLSVPVEITQQVIYPATGATAIVIKPYGLTATGFSFDIAPAVPTAGLLLTGSATAVQAAPLCGCGCGCGCC